VRYVHGATFSSQNSIFFKFGGISWADTLNSVCLSVWALDFAGYAQSEPYAKVAIDMPPAGAPLGRAPEGAEQIERAVRAITSETGASNVSIVAHSWGTMAAGRFAGDNTELVDRLVLFGPVVRRDALKGEPALGPWRFITVHMGVLLQSREFYDGIISYLAVSDPRFEPNL
jgi:pimeloyl-ACP methyl ester carboxylesterase